MKHKLLQISKVIRRRTEATVKEVRQITGNMALMAKEAIKDALTHAKKLVPESAYDRSIIGDIHHTAQVLEKIIRQTEMVNKGETPKERLVSLVDTDARPISKGKLGKRTEFGHILQIAEISEGIITDYQVHRGNPSDKTLLIPAIEHHKELFEKSPRELAADRGYYSSDNETKLTELGVKHVSIPKPGKKSKDRVEHEQSRKFKELQSFRAGVEGRISCIKRKFGQRRSYMRGRKGTSIWCGYGILAHNLRKAAQLITT